MKHPPIPANEAERLADLNTYEILDTLPEEIFDDLTALAAEICGTPIALISLIDAERQWFKSHHGLGTDETPRAFSFCAHAVADDEMLVVPDAFDDERFADNPLVTGDPHVRFYAGALLKSFNGYNLGTLCVIDSRPRELTATQLDHLRRIARQVESQLELRHHAIDAEHLRHLHAVSTARDLTHEERVARILDVGLRYFRMDAAIVARIRGNTWRVKFSAGNADAPAPGTHFDLEDTYCARTVNSRTVTALHDAAAQAPDHPARQQPCSAAYLGAPVNGEDALYGTVSFRNRTPRRRPFSDRERATMGLFTETLGAELARERSRRALQEKETLRKGVEGFFNVSLDLLCIFDARGHFRSVNKAWSEVLGYSHVELESRPFIEFVYHEDRDATTEAAVAVAAGDRVTSFRNRYIAKNGGLHWLQWAAIGDPDAGLVYASARDMTQEMALLERIKNSNFELEAAVEELDQFAYIVSHDLKAPLRAISSLANWIEDDLGGDMSDAVRGHMDTLVSRVHRMEGLIEGILEYSHVTRGKTREGPVALDALIVDVIDSLAPPPSFRIETGAPLPIIHGDRTQLYQVFANLIGNAVKYHDRPDGRAWITCEEQDAAWSFCVRDDGPGIEPAYHEKIFTVFQTLEARDVKESTGIGLSIVRKIIEQRGGSIRIESADGAGAAFHFTWPRHVR